MTTVTGNTGKCGDLLSNQRQDKKNIKVKVICHC